jgi:hypothetical protein
MWSYIHVGRVTMSQSSYGSSHYESEFMIDHMSHVDIAEMSQVKSWMESRKEADESPLRVTCVMSLMTSPPC